MSMRFMVLLVVLCTFAGIGVVGAEAIYAKSSPLDQHHSVLPSLGFTTHLDNLTVSERRAEFAQLASAGASWIRVGVPWYALQPSPNSLDPAQLTKLEQVVSDAALLGMRVLMIGDQAPDWAGGGRHTASNPRAYGSFMGLLAARLAGRGPHGQSPAYEIMNEPNGVPDGQPWASSYDYAKVACSAYRAIKNQDASAVVVAGSLASDWKEWLRSAFKEGLGGCFDVLSAHPYSDLRELNQLRDFAAAEGFPKVNIWVTEFGYSTCSELLCVSEATQAQMLVERLKELGQIYPWVPVAMVYEAQDEPSNSIDGPERSFGVLKRTDGGDVIVPKPALGALQSLYKRGSN